MGENRRDEGSSGRGRRRFFRALTGMAAVALDELRGIRQLSLADLPRLPDQELFKAIPVRTPEWTPDLDGDHIVACFDDGRPAAVICAAGSLQAQVFNGFDGSRSLAEISAEMAQRLVRPGSPGPSPTQGVPGPLGPPSFCKDEAAVRTLVRQVFLELAARRLFVPREPLDSSSIERPTAGEEEDHG